MRVKRAAQLIETGEFNMTQISYMVGINDPRYFSKCFKQRFGMTPTEYKEKRKNRYWIVFIGKFLNVILATMNN